MQEKSKIYSLSKGDNRLYALLDWKWFPGCLFLFYCMIPFLVHADYLTAGDSLVSGDGTGMLYTLHYLGESIKTGDFPIWTPYLAGGMPYADATMLKAFYPVALVCSLLPPFIQFYVYLGIHYAIGGTFLYLYLRKIDCDAIVCVAVSMIYLFTAHMGGLRKEHIGLIVTALWVPVILFFLERYLRERRLKWLLAASGAMALQFFGGFLQYVVYSDIFVFFYLLLSGIHWKFKVKTMLAHGTGWLAAYFGLIAAGVLPMAKLLLLLGDADGEAMSLAIFSVCSLHPIKLLMSVFPQIFGSDIWYELGSRNFSSGMDGELVLGAPCVALIFVGLGLGKKNFYARFARGAGLCALIYAGMAHFELLKNIVYKIPVLNMFRVPSRTLFLVTLCCMILLAIAMSALVRKDIDIRTFHKANFAVAAGMVGIFIVYVISDSICEGAQKLPLQEVFLVPFVLYAVYLVGVYGYLWLKKNRRLLVAPVRYGFPLAIALLTIIQIWPYYKCSYVTPYEDCVAWPEEISDQQTAGKVWCPDLSFGEVSANMSLVSQIPALNAYTNFNLPSLYKLIYRQDSAPMNASGLYMTFFDAERILTDDNDLLSMLGVKHIIVSPEIEADQYVYASDSYTVESTLISEQDVSFTPTEQFQYAMQPVFLEADSWYNIQLTLHAEESEGTFYVDFYDVGYDFPAQEAWFTLEQGTNEYQALIPSDDSDVASNIRFRIIAFTDQELSLSDVTVERITPDAARSDYRLVADKGEYRIYENVNAEELFYPAQKVVSLSEEEKEELYLDVNAYDILHTSYITDGGSDCDFSNTSVQVSNIQLRNNRASADVQADGETFINMSQTYYPGWNAYIDGVKTELYEVNGIIQGAFVPAGTHTVEFRYQPTVFYAGVFVSIAAIGVCAATAYYGEKRRRGPEHESGIAGGGLRDADQ